MMVLKFIDCTGIHRYTAAAIAAFICNVKYFNT